jgi:hypothetical protein
MKLPRRNFLHLAAGVMGAARAAALTMVTATRHRLGHSNKGPGRERCGSYRIGSGLEHAPIHCQIDWLDVNKANHEERAIECPHCCGLKSAP